MEDEVDIDIEGDEIGSGLSVFDSAGLVQEQFVQSAWTSSAGILPWELDSSISPENREAIQRMLLEEQYYLTGKDIPRHLWDSDASSKPKVKISPTKPSASGSSSHWTKQEKDRFEEGLARFGRRWTKIARLVESRSVLQVKSYARQYFKHKNTLGAGSTASSAGPALQPPESASSHLSTSANNTVKIEKLSDGEDEDVDITDDQSDDEEDVHNHLETEVKIQLEQQKQTGLQTNHRTEDHDETGHPEQEIRDEHSSSISPTQSPQPELSLPATEERIKTEQKETGMLLLGNTLKGNLTRDKSIPQSSNSENLAATGQLEQSGSNKPVEQIQSSGEDLQDMRKNEDEEEEDGDKEEEEDDDDEEEDLTIPEQEIELDKGTITEEEKQAIPEFFEGRPSKTPERYLKIRNYILDQWMKIKPKYLNKTCVRPGLKNCGDVNCIGRIHTYLELIGAINFGCEQAVYNRPKVLDRSKHKEGKDVLEAYQLAQRLQSMRTRKRRVRDMWGNWCDAKDLEGQTFEHLSAEELALRREEMKRQPRPLKMARYRESSDPFQLIPCRTFGEDVQEPFQVIVCAETLLIMDMHAHVSRGEVIGLLGGTFNEEAKVLKVSVAEPCNSVSTGLQCEMDPVSQTQASDVLSSLGLSVVGWYHSHPSFHPNPSVRDINTQDQFQSYFSRGGAPFIGMIVSPYDPANPSPHSQTTCLLVKEIQEPSGPRKLPFRFDLLSSQDIPDWEQTFRRAEWIIHKYCQAPGNVQMDRLFRKDSSLTCLEKMLSSLARYLEPLPDDEGEPFLNQIQALFQSDFIAKQPHEESLNTSPRPVDTEDFAFDQLISHNRPQDAREACDQGSGKAFSDRVQTTMDTTSETNNMPVLHMGSVLSSEHDYLL
ncbi:histone H2A deubiquitinase MYSM1 isoform X2 [Cynoglossus semilaevis]|uniref:histone H2A deubiquitinase MYSM1 isoform X2 n=1 Tax=Cynoglossus semilaevis TaxID=244447 RepID=UPI000495113E|nr:histone H2A deubiquitinase MYSM1 isoform X2 [Cynoglossus semilaevis]